MGRWVEVPCGCDEEASCPHVRPEWLEYGVAYETWPGAIMELGKVLGAIDPGRGVFELFPKIGDFDRYLDELLVLGPDDVLAWALEIEAAEDLILRVTGREWRLRSAWLKSQCTPGLQLEHDPAQTLSECRKLCTASRAVRQPVRFML